MADWAEECLARRLFSLLLPKFAQERSALLRRLTPAHELYLGATTSKLRVTSDCNKIAKSWREFRRLLLTVGMLIFSSLFAASTYAASLRRLDDGRVIVSAYGQRIAFREKDAARVEFWDNILKCDPQANLSTSLARWLTVAKETECLDRAIPNLAEGKGYFFFRVTLAVDGGQVYPGDVNPASIPKSAIDERSVEVVIGHSPLRPPTIDPAKLLPTAPFGLRMLVPPGWESSIYVVEASRRLGRTSRPLIVSCQNFSFICSIQIESTDRLAGLILWWVQPEPAGLREISAPQPEWLNYDAAARAIAKSIFIDRPEGDIQ